MLLRWIMICASFRHVHSLEELALSVDLACLAFATGTKKTPDVLGRTVASVMLACLQLYTSDLCSR